VAEEFHKRKTTFNLDAALHRRLKLTAVRHEREMVDIVEEALTNHLRTIERAAGE
jgi:plasmid stability protein